MGKEMSREAEVSMKIKLCRQCLHNSEYAWYFKDKKLVEL